MSLLRERLNEDEAARKRQEEEDAEKAAGPRKLHKRRAPSEANAAPEDVLGEFEVGAILKEEDEEMLKVTQMGAVTPIEVHVDAASVHAQPVKNEEPVNAAPPVRGWLGWIHIPRPSEVISYATGTVRSTASTAYGAATYVPFTVARRVPLVRVFVPALAAATKEEPAAAQPIENEVTSDPDAGAAVPTPPETPTPSLVKTPSAGLVWRTAEFGLGLGLATVLVGAAGADLAYKKAATWRHRNDKPAGYVH